MLQRLAAEAHRDEACDSFRKQRKRRRSATPSEERSPTPTPGTSEEEEEEEVAIATLEETIAQQRTKLPRRVTIVDLESSGHTSTTTLDRTERKRAGLTDRDGIKRLRKENQKKRKRVELQDENGDIRDTLCSYLKVVTTAVTQKAAPPTSPAISISHGLNYVARMDQLEAKLESGQAEIRNILSSILVALNSLKQP